MDAPTCPICRKSEWRHVCSGTTAKRKPGEQTPREEKSARSLRQRELKQKRRARANA